LNHKAHKAHKALLSLDGFSYHTEFTEDSIILSPTRNCEETFILASLYQLWPTANVCRFIQDRQSVEIGEALRS